MPKHIVSILVTRTLETELEIELNIPKSVLDTGEEFKWVSENKEKWENELGKSGTVHHEDIVVDSVELVED